MVKVSSVFFKVFFGGSRTQKERFFVLCHRHQTNLATEQQRTISHRRLLQPTALPPPKTRPQVRGYLSSSMNRVGAPGPIMAAAPAQDPEHERMLQELLQRKMVSQV